MSRGAPSLFGSPPAKGVRRNELCDIAATIVHETAKAVLIDWGGLKPCWLPLSMIEIEKNRDGTVTVTLPVALAEEKEIAL